jgi:hypothetical protein
MIVINSFSMNMLAEVAGGATISVVPVPVETARNLLLKCGVESAVGHADTAAVFSSALGMEIPMARITVALKKGDEILVGQYRGPRMAEGVKTLPAGATIEWLLVAIS